MDHSLQGSELMMVFINHEYAEMYHINLKGLCDGAVNAY